MSPTATRILARSITSDLQAVPSTFSSWDSCMSKSYCKWPVIAAIVIAALIVLSIVSCLARCLCCGMSCCCECFACFGCCNSCTRPRQRREPRYKEEYNPMPYQGYQPMPQPSPLPSYQPPPPQFATFDTPSRVHEDSLPAMPTWDAAQRKQVEDHIPAVGGENGMEMNRLTPPTSRLESQPNTLEPQMSGTALARPGYGRHGSSQASPLLQDHPKDDYVNHPYNAEPYRVNPGAQRLSPRPQQYHQQQLQSTYHRQQSGSDFQPSSLSPAPTYTTFPQEYRNQVAPPPLTVSPPPAGTYDFSQHPLYHHQQPPLHQDQISSPSDTTSTRYEPTEYATTNHHFSPVEQQQPPSFQAVAPNAGARPPSLLQIGRRPVNGSVREL